MVHDMIDQASYMAHGYCLLWKPWLVALHAGSDLLIFASYFAIPAAIVIFLRRRKDLELRSLAVLFATFIFLCGLTHLVQMATLWWPIYETQGWLKALTAVVSVATAIAIFPLIPTALSIPSPRQLQLANEGLAREVASHRTTLAELQQAREELEARVAERTKELEVSKARFEALVQASAQVVWTTSATGSVEEDSPSWRLFTGQSYEEWRGTGWLNVLHPEDRAPTLAAWHEAIKTRQMYAVEYRLRHVSGEWRWTAAKGVPLFNENGAVAEWVGMNTDITERHRAEEHTQLIMRELSHRTKNLLAVVAAMARQTARIGVTAIEFAKDFGGRLQGLARSHDLLVDTRWEGAVIAELVQSQLHIFTPLDRERVTISGPHLLLRPEATQALGLALHELATNAVKHGALAGANGHIDVTWSVVPRQAKPAFRLSWTERTDAAGPISDAERARGFGSIVLQSLLPQSLSGEVAYDLDSDGVFWEITAPLSQIQAGPRLRPDLSEKATA